MTADGFCETCGHKAPSGRDHVEIDLGALAGVTDRGRRHGRNEDAMALAVTQTPRGPAALAVVCDGVSTSHRPDDASLAAAETALRVLTAELRTGTPAADALTSATVAAHKTVSDMAAGSEDAPATTIVCACVADAVAVCWVGDSRAYWLPADHSDARLLTRDDSLGEVLVAAGALTETEAVESPEGHVLTRWLGADAEQAEPPHTTSFEPAGPGVLLLCSDGLWNYEPSAAGLAALMPDAAVENLAAAAASLVEFALDRGGEDNITAVLASFPCQ